MGLAQDKIQKIQNDMKALKVKIDEMKSRKSKNPMGFSYLENMQLQSNIGMYDELAAKVKSLASGKSIV